MLEVKGVLKSVTIKRKNREVLFYYGGTDYHKTVRLQTRLNGLLGFDTYINNGQLFLIPRVIKEYFNGECKRSISVSWGRNTVAVEKDVNETTMVFNNAYGGACGRETIRLIGACADKFIAENKMLKKPYGKKAYPNVCFL